MPSPPPVSVASDSKKNRYITIMSLVSLGLALARPVVPNKYNKWIDIGHSVLDTLVDNQVIGLENPDTFSTQPIKHLASAMLDADSNPDHPLNLDDSVRKSLVEL